MTRTTAALVAIVSALVMLIARAAGPAESWDNSQPRTMAGTVDLLEHGRWILPIENGQDPLRKPPLYNWLAAPAVAVLGADSAFAHKWPSAAAALVVALTVAVAGARLAHDPWLGAVGAAFGAGTFMFAKLGWLARPDMVLTAALVVGWACATALMAYPDSRGARRGFWVAVGVAALAKGPPAVLLLLFAAIAPRAMKQRVSFGWRVGAPLALLPAAAWALAVYVVDRDFAIRVLVGEEVIGRMTGLGPEGGQGGLKGWVLGLPEVPLYAATRYAPASLLALVAAIGLFRRARPDGPRRWRELGDAGRLLASAALFAAIVMAAFTVSEGKRADYIAAVIGPFGLLGAAALLGPAAAGARARSRVGAGVCGAAAALAGNAVVLLNTAADPCPRFGDAIDAFVAEVRPFVAAERDRVEFSRVGRTHLRAALGFSRADVDSATLRARLRAGETLLLVAGSMPEETTTWQERVQERCAGFAVQVETVIAGPTLVAHSGWPWRVDLLRVARVDPLERFRVRAWNMLDPVRERVSFRGLGDTPIPGMLGFEAGDLDSSGLRAALRADDEILVVVGGPDDGGASFRAWVERRAVRFLPVVERVLDGVELPAGPGWPARIDVYRVYRTDAQDSPPNVKG